MSALLWLLMPLFAGIAASVWAWRTGRRSPSPPDHDTWEDLDRYQRLRTVLSAKPHAKMAFPLREGRLPWPIGASVGTLRRAAGR
ncbi:hypothetical protein [Streptomyces cyanogenus]|uniref:Uncharacterized protein n=1 Tax=Streptomyces cyanogenus TaxID=80860 RepID=A0ABX7TLM1_STRCY|nr:hypothetical protein [Streptomyces cyanogenus]QTD96483.1 hypothetical protein S1361_03935 [Streptomyces cyanogenus]